MHYLSIWYCKIELTKESQRLRRVDLSQQELKDPNEVRNLFAAPSPALFF